MACEYAIQPGSDRTVISVSGLSENMDAAVELFESLLADAQPEPQVLEMMKADILKGRADEKLDQQSNFKRLTAYGLYGPDSPATHILSATELREIEAG